MTLEEFQKWAEAEAYGTGLDEDGLERVLLQAFLLGQGATYDTVTLLTEQHDRIEKLNRKLEEVIYQMHRPDPETVVDTIADALTNLCNRVDRIDASLSSVAAELEGKASASALTVLTSRIDQDSRHFV